MKTQLKTVETPFGYSTRVGSMNRVGIGTHIPTHYLEKHYPIENRTDFFKWVIVTPNGLAKDFEGKEMYFDSFALDHAKDVLRAIKKVALKKQ